MNQLINAIKSKLKLKNSKYNLLYIKICSNL